MNCPNCKSEIQDEVKYCPNCGYHLPSLIRGKSTFDVAFLKKVFGRKEKQKPIITDSSEKKIELRKERKWGWGWYILAAFVGYSIDKTYAEYGDSKGILYLLGIGLSILIYFYFRNKLLKEVSFLRLRSFISGVISLILTSIVIGLTANLVAPDIYGSVSRSITKEIKNISSSLNSFKKEDETLWSFFVDEPSTASEYKNNIRILEKSIPLYKSKDSVALFAYNKLFTILNDAEEKYPNKMKQYPMTSAMVSSVINSYTEFSIAMQNKFIALQDYYNAHLENNPSVNSFWNKVLITQEELESKQAKYLQASNKFSESQTTLNSK